VLKWIVDRIEGEADAVDTPIGRVPTPDSLDLDGLDIDPAKLAELLAVDASIWREEASLSARDLAKLGDRVPHAIKDEHARLEQRLGAAA
jgi:phosphoenolpyruvate carboxykinase (GTP)